MALSGLKGYTNKLEYFLWANILDRLLMEGL